MYLIWVFGPLLHAQHQVPNLAPQLYCLKPPLTMKSKLLTPPEVEFEMVVQLSQEYVAISIVYEIFYILYCHEFLPHIELSLY
mgnify:CR=1 FL=1